MCYHTALVAQPRQLALRFGRSEDRIRAFRPTYHVSAFSHAEYPIVTTDEHIELFRWGLIPFWTHGLDDALTIRNRTLNARAESIFSKPSFRDAARKRRCLVPATGFFDWRHERGRRIPYYISLKNRPIFALAGIYDTWRNPVNHEEVSTYSIVTTRANELMSFIHNTNFRMPVILRPEEEELWLDPLLSEQDAHGLMRPYSGGDMESRVITNDFLKKSPYDPTILQESEPAAVPVR